MKQYPLNYALELWRNSQEAKNVDANFEKYLSIALRQYVFPKIDPKAKNLDISQFASYSASFPVEKLKDALEIFESSLAKAVESQEISVKTGNNYRSALKRFLQWLEKQAWWNCLFPDPIAQIAPLRPKLSPEPVVIRGDISSYGLAKDDLPEHALKEFEDFKQFRLTGGKNIKRTVRSGRQHSEDREARRPKIGRVKLSSFKNDEERILRFLGWYVKNNPLSELHLELLTDLELLDDYTHWATTNRGVSHSIGVNMAKTAIAIAKWLNYDKSTRRNWSDIEVILDLKDLRNEYAEKYAKEKKQSDQEKLPKKIITHPEAREIVEYLRTTCAPRSSKRYKEIEGVSNYSSKRRNSAVARSWQIYLLVKILVYCPVRQEEIRNFKLGETLFREEDEQGNPYYIVNLTEHKLDSETGKLRHYRLPSILTEDLDMWVYKWRPLIEESIKTLDGWMDFWGHPPDKIEQIRRQLELAKQGVFEQKIKSSPEEYIYYLEQKLKALEERISYWPVAKENFESHNYLFFMFGKNRKNDIEAFGQPHEVDSVWRVFRKAIAMGSQALFGEARWTNPQLLRNIAEKHIRQSGNRDITESFGMLIGHSKKMGDEYAQRITSEYELSEDISDDWWYEEA